MEITISTKERQSLIDITAGVREAVASSGVKNGICNVYVPHATAAITINENADPNLPLDIVAYLRGAVKEGVWKHDQIDNNAAAHIKAAIIGPSETIPVRDGELQLGRWQDIFLCCFDGPRKRRIIVTIIEGK
jgi:secondary thiamine-phosphate synthase enzyme